MTDRLDDFLTPIETKWDRHLPADPRMLPPEAQRRLDDALAELARARRRAWAEARNYTVG